MSRPLVACLACTSRPEWRPWLLRQYEKQTWPEKELFIDDGEGLIPEKRTRLLARAKAAGVRWIAWFDDDDWSSEDRLGACVMQLSTNPYLRPAAVGNVRSYMVHVGTRKGITYHAPEGIIFNGAVFEIAHCPQTFSLGLPTGEDTDWLERWHRRRPTYLVLGQPLSVWLCHKKNITNRSDTRSYTENVPNLISEEEWNLVPAK